MEIISFNYSIADNSNDSGNVNVSLRGDYIDLDAVARKFKDFLNAVGYPVENVGIDTGDGLFLAVDED